METKMAKQQQVVVLLAIMSSSVASAASCNVGALMPCAGALSSGVASASCCSSLRSHQSCFCTYAKNPASSSYINSPNARKVVASCGIAVPRC